MMKLSSQNNNRPKNKKWACILTTLFFILDCFVLCGQNFEQIPHKRCPVKTINFEQGLMNTSITSAITDNTGYTWFSTRTGLQRYNGYFLETINPVADGDTIRINYPVFFLSQRDHSFLIGYKKGILEFNPENNSFKKIFSVNPTETLQYSLVPFKETDEGIWCLQQNRGIVIYTSKGALASTLLAFDAASADSIFHSDDLFQSNKIITANDNFIFIRLSPVRIAEINMKTRQITNLDYPAEKICGLSCNRENIFIASKEGLSCVRISDGKTIHLFLYKRITDEHVNFSTIELTEDNHLLVSVGKRLFDFDTACACQKEYTNLNSDFIVNTGDIPFIYEDKFRRIWILSLDEIKRIQNINIPFEHLIYPKEKNNFVRSIYLDEDENLLLSGCFNGGIELYNLSGKTLWGHSLITKDVKDVIGIEKLSTNHYLLITLHKGLFVLNSKSRQLHGIDLKRNPFSQMHIEENAYTNSMQRIDDSIIYISTRSNIYRCIFKKNIIISSTPLLPASPFYNYPITCFIHTADNSLWIGTELGVLIKLDAYGSLRTINIPENYFIKCMATDSMHNIWVGTEKGIFIFSPTGEPLRTITKQSGLLNDVIYSLLPAGNNNFFASTNLGLSFIPKDGKVKNFTKELGLQENEFNTQSCAREITGKLFFGGINGITAFNPYTLFNPNDTPFINITKLTVNDSLYNSFGGAWQHDSLKLSYNQNRLQFDIAAMGLLNPDEYVYQYRFRGFEDSWQSTTQPRDIRYTLQPGKYVLEINCSPILSANTVFHKKIVVIIFPPWWQTWWFRSLAFILLVSAIAFTMLIYDRQKYYKKIQLLQIQNEIKSERERISKELHDNIGTQLSYISSNIDWMLDAPVSLSKEEEIERLSIVNNTTKEVISDLRNTIWAIKKEAIHFDEIADKLKLFIQSQRILKQETEIIISENIMANITFSPTEALNLFRICQEAIANCVKHANASKLNLSIQSGENDFFSIIIEDNGQGFLVNGEFKEHYGLENMRSRANELGATLSIVSGKTKGTRIILTKGSKSDKK